jgi:hypothetical protein
MEKPKCRHGRLLDGPCKGCRAEIKAREEIRAREAAENGRAIVTAKRYGKNVTFIADDGCEVTVTPGGHVFHNVADWY